MKNRVWLRLLCAALVALMMLPLTACDPAGEQGTPTEEVPTTQPSDTEPAPDDSSDEQTTPEESESETEPDDGIPLDDLKIGGVDITSFTLVVQEDGFACVRNSADELVQYLEQATGFCIEEKASEHEIVIGVTDRDTAAVTEARAKVELDGYTMLMDGGKLYITGSCDRGTMYGV